MYDYYLKSEELILYNIFKSYLEKRKNSHSTVGQSYEQAFPYLYYQYAYSIHI